MTYQDKLPVIILWAARILGSLIVLFFLFFLTAHIFGEDESGEGFRNVKDVITFIIFPISSVVGLSLALKWEGLGGLITTVGMVSLLVLRPDLLHAPFVMAPIIPGILFILYWYKTKKRTIQTTNAA